MGVEDGGFDKEPEKQVDEAEQTEAAEAVTEPAIQLDVVPNPKFVKEQVAKITQDKADEFTANIKGAADALAVAKEQNKFIAKIQEISAKRKDVTAKYAAQEGLVAKQAAALKSDVQRLLSQEVKTKEQLEAAEKRVAAKLEIVQEEIDELGAVKEAIILVQDLGIDTVETENVEALDVNGDGLLDLNDINAIDDRIAELQDEANKIQNDATFNALSIALDKLEAAETTRNGQVAEKAKTAAELRGKKSQDLAAVKTSVFKDRSSAVISAQGNFDLATGKQQDAVAQVQEEYAEVIAQEEADYKEMKQLESADWRQTWKNTIGSLSQAFSDAIDALKATVVGAHDAETEAAAQKKALLESRAAKIGSPK